MKKFLATVIALIMVLALANAALADGVGGACYQEQYGEYEEEYEYTAKLAVGKADANGNVGTGAIVIIKDDGSTVTGNGITANAAATVKGTELKGKLRAGTEEYNTSLAGDVSIGTAGAGGSVTAGIGNDGDIELSAKIGAEANIAEANAEVSGTVAGVKIAAKAGVKVGVGAKANVGYSDGKLKCELSAALGVGGTIGFEVDVGAIVRKTKKATETTTNVLKCVWKVLWS